MPCPGFPVFPQRKTQKIDVLRSGSSVRGSVRLSWEKCVKSAFVTRLRHLVLGFVPLFLTASGLHLAGVDAAAQSIAGGGQHTVAISQGVVSTWGDNVNGQLADGSNTSRPTPGQLAVAGVVAVAAGGDHTLFLTSAGSVLAAGHYSGGQLGIGEGARRRRRPMPSSVT
jgi:alpha-tubulin suppressor-like RCC1 family protein